MKLLNNNNNITKLKTKMKYYLLVIMSLILASCGSAKFNQSFRLSPNMTKEEVLSIMGDPMKSDFDRNVEEWHYCRTQLDSEEFLALYFVDGILLTKTNYTVREENRGSVGSCAQFIKMGDYRVPDVVLEVRNK